MHGLTVDAPDGGVLQIIRRDTPGGVVVNVTGDVDLGSAHDFEAHLLAAFAETDGRVVLDLGGVTFMDSAGIGSLVRAQRRAGSGLRIRAMHRSVRRVLELASLLDRFAFEDAPSEHYGPRRSTG